MQFPYIAVQRMQMCSGVWVSIFEVAAAINDRDSMWNKENLRLRKLIFYRNLTFRFKILIT